jgi:hypothetical protein
LWGATAREALRRGGDAGARSMSSSSAIDGAERRLAQLQEENRRLRGELKSLQGDQADIYYYLQKKLDDNYEVISELEKRIISEQVSVPSFQPLSPVAPPAFLPRTPHHQPPACPLGVT